MGTHLIPREVSGEGRILYIFTPKGFIYTLIGLAIGAMMKSFLDVIGAKMVGWVIMAVFALIGWAIGQGKIPDSSANSFFKKTGGEPIETVIKRYFKFNKSKKIYITKAVNEDINKENAENVENTENVENVENT